MSARSEMLRIDAACGLAVLAREICEDVEVFTFSERREEGAAAPRLRPARRDRAEPAARRAPSSATRCTEVDQKGVRLIVITDEQAHDAVAAPKGNGYMINVASYRNGVGRGDWTRVDGFSEAVIDWIIAQEEGRQPERPLRHRYAMVPPRKRGRINALRRHPIASACDADR